MTRLVSATVILVLVAAVGYLAESASASVTGRLTGQVSVQGQSDLATVKTRLFALPSTLKQPIELANVVPYLFDLDRAGRFERELPAGTYLVGFTNPKLEFESSDATVKLIRNADILSLPVKSIAVRENASANLDLKITAASAALPDPDPRALTEPLGGGAPPFIVTIAVARLDVDFGDVNPNRNTPAKLYGRITAAVGGEICDSADLLGDRTNGFVVLQIGLPNQPAACRTPGATVHFAFGPNAEFPLQATMKLEPGVRASLPRLSIVPPAAGGDPDRILNDGASPSAKSLAAERDSSKALILAAVGVAFFAVGLGLLFGSGRLQLLLRRR